jgi:membrane associated rhomboid family serine protease
VPASFSAPTLVTSMFLHGSWSHVIGNMWFLWIFGDNIEDRLGHGRFVLFYLFCGMGAAVGHIMLNPASMLPTIGASGAIAGVMGAYFVLYPHSRVLTLVPLFIFWEIVELPAIFLLGFWFLMQLFGAGIGTITPTSGVESGGIAFMAHIAGFALGALIVFVVGKSSPEPRRWA